MGLIKSIESVSDVSNLLIDDDQVKQIDLWDSAYKGNPEWIHKKWTSALNNTYSHTQKSLNMPKILSKKMASLVFSKKVNILVTPHVDGPKKDTDDDQGANDANNFIQDTLDDNYFYNNCERYLEYMFGTGGMVIRFYIANGKVKIRFATADAFYPISQDENGVTECVIASKFVKGGKYYTLLEWHLEDDKNYIVRNDLYESIDSNSNDDLGTSVPLSIVYGDSLKPESNYPKTSYSRPTFIYLKPNLANNFSYNSPLGISIFANAIDTLKQLDQAYDMLNQEMEMGRRRIIVPDNLMSRGINRYTGDPEFHMNFDERVYQSFTPDDMSGRGTTSPEPKDITLPLRTQEIIETINSLLDILAAQTGFSAGSFSYSNTQGLETATGVISRNSDTYQSKNSHETILEDAFKKMCQTILELGKAAGIYTDDTNIDVSVNFDDSIAKDRTENANYYEVITGNKPLMPRKEAIKQAFSLTDKQAQEYVDQLTAEESQGSMDDILDNHNGTREDDNEDDHES